MGEKTRHVVANAINDFSIGQVYSFIWRASKDAAAFYVRERVTKTHAANTVVGAIERSAERAVANGWDVKDYRRDRRVPETPLVQVFAASTGLGERYWSEVPGAELRSAQTTSSRKPSPSPKPTRAGTVYLIGGPSPSAPSHGHAAKA